MIILVLFSGLDKFAFAQETFITISGDMDDVIFDGKSTVCIKC